MREETWVLVVIRRAPPRLERLPRIGLGGGPWQMRICFFQNGSHVFDEHAFDGRQHHRHHFLGGLSVLVAHRRKLGGGGDTFGGGSGMLELRLPRRLARVSANSLQIVSYAR